MRARFATANQARLRRTNNGIEQDTEVRSSEVRLRETRKVRSRTGVARETRALPIVSQT
jgi:hypothetical protein